MVVGRGRGTLLHLLLQLSVVAGEPGDEDRDNGEEGEDDKEGGEAGGGQAHTVHHLLGEHLTLQIFIRYNSDTEHLYIHETTTLAKLVTLMPNQEF